MRALLTWESGPGVMTTRELTVAYDRCPKCLGLDVRCVAAADKVCAPGKHELSESGAPSHLPMECALCDYVFARPYKPVRFDDPTPLVEKSKLMSEILRAEEERAWEHKRTQVELDRMNEEVASLVEEINARDAEEEREGRLERSMRIRRFFGLEKGEAEREFLKGTRFDGSTTSMEEIFKRAIEHAQPGYGTATITAVDASEGTVTLEGDADRLYFDVGEVITINERRTLYRKVVGAARGIFWGAVHGAVSGWRGFVDG